MIEHRIRAVALASLLQQVHALITRFLVLPGAEYADTLSLWIGHAHTIKAATTSPRLVIKSAELASGKTRVLEVLETLVPSPLNTISASTAAIFRLLKEEASTTILLDEADALWNPRSANQHEDLRALLNGGWHRGATVARVTGEGKKMRVERYPVFAATAIACIGNLPATIESRAIIIPMRRRAPDEPLEPFRLRKVVWAADELRAQLAQWAERYGDELAEHEPRLPAGINDRLGDSWEPLIGLGDFAGDEWAARARTAAEKIAGGHVMDEASTGVQLLGHIKTVLAGHDRMASAALLAALNGMDEAPWGAWNDGRGMQPRDLARRLKPYAIASGSIRLPDGTTPKGYLRADFGDAWRRYLSPSVQAPQAPQAPQERIAVAAVADVALRRKGEANGSRGPSDGTLFDQAYFDDLVSVGARVDEMAE